MEIKKPLITENETNIFSTEENTPIKKTIFRKCSELEQIKEENPFDRLNNSDELKKSDIDAHETLTQPDLEIERATSVRRNAYVPINSKQEEDIKREIIEIKETVKKTSLRKKSLAPDVINSNNILKRAFLKIDTNEEKLNKMEQCKFIEQEEIY